MEKLYFHRQSIGNLMATKLSFEICKKERVRQKERWRVSTVSYIVKTNDGWETNKRKKERSLKKETRKKFPKQGEKKRAQLKKEKERYIT